MKRSWIAVGVLGLLLTGCGSGITQEQYDELQLANASMSEALASAQAEASSAKAELYTINAKSQNADKDQASQSDLVKELRAENESMSMLIMSMQQAAHETPQESAPEESVAASESQADVSENAQSTPPRDNGSTIVIDAPVKFENCIVTVRNIKVIKDDRDNYFVKVTYDWENTSDESAFPSVTMGMVGYQNGLETDINVAHSDEVDYGIGQKKAMPGGKIIGAQDTITIDDINSPITIILHQFIHEDIGRTLIIQNPKDLM